MLNHFGHIFSSLRGKRLLSAMAVPALAVVWAVYAFSPADVAPKPSDAKATKETRRLYQNLFKLKTKGVMFGHQDDLAYGVGWKDEDGRSDIKSVAGDYPAVYGWDLGHLELDSAKNFDGVPFNSMVNYVREIYSRGGVSTISWHMIDPVTGKTAWSNDSRSVVQILTDPAKQALYKAYLDKLAVLVTKFKGAKGEAIPVIFRPFHENTGAWFWWGTKSCSSEEFIALWRLTVDYLRNEKKLHNLLYAYSPADFDSEANYMATYPGDAYVDVLGFDLYANADSAYFAKTIDQRCAIVQQAAVSHHKIAALTETGYENIPDAQWWTKAILPVVNKYDLSYLLVWRNWKDSHFFAPYPGQKSEDDFKDFYSHERTLFQREMPAGIYKKNL